MALPPRCLASKMMTPLLVWRNPQGSEERWMGRPQAEQRSIAIHLCKTIPTEFGLALLFAAALVETAVYATFALLSGLFFLVEPRPFTFFATLLGSSSFALLWGWCILIINTLEPDNLPTQESFARLYANWIFADSRHFARHQDDFYVADWARRHGGVAHPIMRPYRVPISRRQDEIDWGATLMAERVLADASVKTKERFHQVDPALFQFVLMKTLFLCAYRGVRETGCFNSITVFGIRNLRRHRENLAAEEIDRLAHTLSSPEELERAEIPNDPNAPFNVLRSLAIAELQGSAFLSDCWQRACELLPAPPEEPPAA